MCGENTAYSESEERLAQYLEEMRDNALREWRKRKGTGS
jgi:hypothetical protein